MVQKWHQSNWFRLSLAVFVLLLLALLLVPLLVPLDRFRPLIVDLIQEQTGRQVEIEALRLHLVPSTHVRVLNFRLKHPKNFPAGDTLVVKEIDIGAELWPLLSRQLKVTYVTLDGIEVNLLEDQRGRTNYNLASASKKIAKKKKDEGDSEAPLFSLSEIDSITVSNITVSSGTFHTRRKKQVTPSFTLTGLNTEIRRLDLNDPGFLKKLEVFVDLAGVEVTTPALTKPLRFEEGKLTLADGAGEGSFVATLDTLRARGTLKVANLNRPRADFNITIPQVNLAELGSLVAGGKNQGRGSRRRARPAGRRLLARGTIKVNKLLLPPLSAENFTSRIRVYEHKVDADPFSVAFYGGQLEGAANLNRAVASQPMQLTAKVQNVDVEKVVLALSPKAEKRITGTFEATAQLGTFLAADPLAQLTGQGTFAVRNGTFPGVDLQGTLVKTAKFLQMKVPRGDTIFNFFGGDYRVQNQRVHSREIKLDAEALKGTVKGSFGFDGTLDYKGSGVLTGEGQQTQQQEQEQEERRSFNPLRGLRRALGAVMQQTFGRLRVPFVLKGTMQDPKFTLAGTPQPISDQQPTQSEQPKPEEKKSLFNLFRKKN